MMRSVYWASLAAVVKSALADTHYLYSGFFSGSTIVAVEFDSDTNSLSVVNNITADISGSKWILLDVGNTQAFAKLSSPGTNRCKIK